MLRITLLMLPLLLSACSLFRPAAPATDAQDTSAPPIAAVQNALQSELEKGGDIYRVDAAASDLRIYVFRGGRAPTMGKNHVITAPGLQGFVALHSELPTDAHFALGLHLDRLALDPPALRAQTGGSFAKPLTEEQIEGTRENMLGPSVLDAEQYPELVLRAVEISGDWPVLVARVEVQLHGRSHIYDSLMQVERGTGRLQATGSLVIRQTDFGIEPMTVLGGLLGIQDAIGIEYRIVTKAITAE
ncbi:YceI family protein [Algiphilus sp.]|uniref:YceI family protein n=1 Tax=Algiphilus sp. TaxID=1872431 RepID=UPI003B52D5D6